jgi:uncharacterized protein (TIRG00374 family)
VSSPRLKQALKLLLVAAFLWLLVKKGFISLEATGRAFGRLDLILPAFLVSLGSMMAGALRWQCLLRAQGLHLPFRRTLQLTLIGNFFNVLIPGAVSGDFVKAYYVGNEIEGKRAQAFGSILFDRIVGLSALVVVSASALILGFHTFEGTPLLAGIKVFMGVSASCVVAFYAYLFFVRENHDPLLRLLRAFEQQGVQAGKANGKAKWMGSVVRIYLGVRYYHHHRAAVLGVLALSFAIHLSVGWSCLQFAHALGETQIQLMGLYVVVPIGLLDTASPVAPAGVGTGHAAFLSLFHLIGSDRGADVYTLVALSNLAIGMIGALVYLPFRARAPQSVKELGAAAEG